MQFESIYDLFNMAGHGPYVWSAYAITGVIILGLCFSPTFRLRKVKTEIRRIQVRDSQTPNSQHNK